MWVVARIMLSGGPSKLDPVTALKQKIKDYGYMHMDKWDLLISITAKAMLAAEVRGRTDAQAIDLDGPSQHRYV